MEGSTKEIHLMKILKASLFKELVELDLAGVAFLKVLIHKFLHAWLLLRMNQFPL